MSILEVKGLKKTYTTRFGGNQVQALKNVSFSVEEGDYVETGAVIGHVAEPTKYYSVEGSNVYFKLTKDGEAVNPLDYLG